jgi:hypothetical protein
MLEPLLGEDWHHAYVIPSALQKILFEDALQRILDEGKMEWLLGSGFRAMSSWTMIGSLGNLSVCVVAGAAWRTRGSGALDL